MFNCCLKRDAWKCANKPASLTPKSAIASVKISLLCFHHSRSEIAPIKGKALMCVGVHVGVLWGITECPLKAQEQIVRTLGFIRLSAL